MTNRCMSRRAFASLAGASGATGVLALTGCAASSAGASEADASSTQTDSQAKAASATTQDAPLIQQPLDNGYGTGTHRATMEVRGYGTLSLELYAGIAPITVSNFCQLVSDGFYDGLTFHRIIPGFMIQGGDPKHDGTGGADRRIKGEFSANGVANGLQHKRGTISMGRTAASYDSASSQFFIVQQDRSSLDGQYAAFGRVTEGMEVVDAICNNVPTQDSNGTTNPEDQPVITTVKMVD